MTLRKMAIAVANYLYLWAGQERRCYICWVSIHDYGAVIRDHHLCSECHALTRTLADRRRKERKQRAKKRKGTLMVEGSGK